MSPTVEEWRPVRLWEARYEVSNHGRVRNPKGYILRGGKTGTNRNYRSVSLSRNGTAYKKYVHQMVADAFLGPRPFPGAEVRHIRGAAAGDGADNLAWGSHADNMADMAHLGESCCGEARSNAKLTEEAVRQIRASSAPIASLAAQFGVSEPRISKVRHGHIWKHVQ